MKFKMPFTTTDFLLVSLHSRYISITRSIILSSKTAELFY